MEDEGSVWMIRMATRKPGWGNHASALDKNFHIERFNKCTKEKPIKFWCFGPVVENLVHFQFGMKSIPCLKSSPDSDDCPYCQMTIPVRAGAKVEKPWVAQYEGYIAGAIERKSAEHWEPAVGVLTHGALKLLGTHHNPKEKGEQVCDLYPHLQGLVLDFYRVQRGQSTATILEFVVEYKATPPIPDWDPRPCMEKFWNPHAKIAVPPIPAPIPLRKFKPAFNNVSAADREFYRDYAFALQEAMRNGEELTEAEFRRQREDAAAESEWAVIATKRNIFEGKPADNPRTDRGHEHAADKLGLADLHEIQRRQFTQINTTPTATNRINANPSHDLPPASGGESKKTPFGHPAASQTAQRQKSEDSTPSLRTFDPGEMSPDAQLDQLEAEFGDSDRVYTEFEEKCLTQGTAKIICDELLDSLPATNPVSPKHPSKQKGNDRGAA